jgi:hypothetical protein
MTFEDERKLDIARAPDAARYIASLTDELARLAKSHDFEALAYILDMARLEASHVSRQWSTQPRGSGPS